MALRCNTGWWISPSRGKPSGSKALWHAGGTPFHRPAWLQAVAAGTGNAALALVAEWHGEVQAYLPLIEVHSPVFGRMLASSGFAVVDTPSLVSNPPPTAKPLDASRSVEEQTTPGTSADASHHGPYGSRHA